MGGNWKGGYRGGWSVRWFGSSICSSSLDKMSEGKGRSMKICMGVWMGCGLKESLF